MNKKYFSVLIKDFISIIILGALGAFFIFPYFNTEFIYINYPDWIVHAFRAKFLQEYGLSSWSHVWSNGISLWKAYQFIPHYLTIAVSQLFHQSIPRSMVILIIGLFISIHIIVYIALRFLKFRPSTAFVCALLSFDMAQYAVSIGDYSLMFGSTLAPIIYYMWIRFNKDKLQLVYPYVTGLLFYIHPLLGFLAINLWACTVMFTKRNILSLNTAMQAGIIFATSSLFWLPIAFKNSYLQSGAFLANKYFLNLTLSGFDYFGLSLVLLCCLFASVPLLFMHLKPDENWIKILSAFLLGYLVLVFVGINVDLPRVINQFQYTRGVVYIGIGTLFVFAPIMERLLSIKSLIVKLLIVVIVSLSLVDGIWLTSKFTPAPSVGYDDPISPYAKNQNINLSDGRVWSNYIGNASYYSPLTTKLPYSYMTHLEPNQIPIRLNQLIAYKNFDANIPQSNLDRITNYFKITGTKYIFFDETSAFTKSLLASANAEYQDEGKVSTDKNLTHVFKSNWESRDAVMISQDYKTNLKHFPFDLDFSKSTDQLQLDNYTKAFVTMLYQPSNIPLKIKYPTQDSLTVEIPPNPSSNLVYINESYDKEWKATYNNKDQLIQSTGPNYMLVSLESFPAGGQLVLKHVWPTSFYVSWFFITTIPLLIIFNIIMNHIIFKPRKKVKEYV